MNALTNAFTALTGALNRVKRNDTPETIPMPTSDITVRVLQELVSHEAIVLEAYRDSVGIWTWGVGVTDASGHRVGRYKNNPQTVGHTLRIFAWLVEQKYAPPVRKAFKGRNLTEAQFAAALSFHYNTGAIGRASWVRHWLAGDIARAKTAFMEWRNPPEIIPRRAKERDLFFDGKWTSDGMATVYGVRKPSYTPDWSSARRVDISHDLARAIGGA
tara:strand:- start:1938 stop:2585 length:648 start_codon:yes stop_codon:yes gene_type:complete